MNKAITTIASITVLVALIVALSYRPQQAQPNEALTINNCASDLECEQVASYADFDTDASQEAE